jgi:hypothetical protein
LLSERNLPADDSLPASGAWRLIGKGIRFPKGTGFVYSLKGPLG